MISIRHTALKWLWIAVLVILIDQITKYWVSHSLSLYESIPVLPFFNLVFATNKGAAFSFLNQVGDFAHWFFSAIALVMSIFLMIWLSRLKQKRLLSIALSLVIGGALGNLIDRLLHGYVIDFLDFYIQSWHWPAFNVADAAITVGAILLAIDFLRTERQ